MPYLWPAVLGLLVTGWFVLDGFVLGVGITSPWLARDVRERRWARTAVGPFVLGSEMWLIASAGVLAFALPHLESVLSGCYPLVVALLACWILRDAALWLGRRSTRSASWRRWDLVWAAASMGVAYCAGALVGALAHGIPHGAPAYATLFGPVAVLSGLAMVALLALHGAVVVRLRVPAPACERAAAALPRLGQVAAVLAAATVVAGLIDPGVRGALSPAALVGVAGPVAALLVPGRNAAGHPGRAFALGAVAVAAPALAVGIGLVATVAGTSGSGGLAAVVLGAVPVMLAYQALLWWLFRRPVTRRATVFF